MARYSDIRASLRTGDMVLFSGSHPLSLLIRAGRVLFGKRASKWSHVGVIIRSPDPDMVLLWEAIGSGVQLISFSEKLRSYKGKIALRRLVLDRSDDDFHGVFVQARRELGGRPYEKSTWQWIKAAWDAVGGKNVRDLSSIFCSELVAEIYYRWGLLPEDPPSNEYEPADFDGVVDDMLLSGRFEGPELVGL